MVVPLRVLATVGGRVGPGLSLDQLSDIGGGVFNRPLCPISETGYPKNITVR
jgi:hypothetical protein